MQDQSLARESNSDMAVRLTEQVKAGGCASKLPPGLLQVTLARLPAQTDPNMLVGFDKSDDAGVYRIAQDVALVQTVDFFTPMVDDPYTYGQIAATNALSDVYAMGGEPVTALSCRRKRLNSPPRRCVTPSMAHSSKTLSSCR